MKQNNWQKRPSSFAETVQLVENYVKEEITQETKDKQLFYHTLDHALAVKRRASDIFKLIKPVLQETKNPGKLSRLESLINLCAIAHDMIQQFVPRKEIDQPRKRLVGVSETATVKELTKYIQHLNQELATYELDSSVLFSNWDLQIIEDAISATICDRDPQAGKVSYSFSPYSIYQPYLYNSQPKISVVGSIIALADLGTLGMEGVEKFLQEGILVFLEDNLDLKDLILSCDRYWWSKSNLPNSLDQDTIRARLLNMTRFIVSLAQERQARLELEIAGFTPPARQILREKIFVYLNTENIKKIQTIVPTDENTDISELINFFCLFK